VDRQSVVKAHELLRDHFIEQHCESLRETVLNFNGTGIKVYGDQPERLFKASYHHHCYFPLYVFCVHHLLMSYVWDSPIFIFMGI